ncbi:hypothetical protein [Pararhodobacter marinus]|nr:hypothetical protein [Pararhodobacter marinus]
MRKPRSRHIGKPRRSGIVPAQDDGVSGLRQLWMALGVPALLVCANVLVLTQGGDLGLGGLPALTLSIGDETPEALAGFWGVILLGLFGIAGNLVLARHARLSRGGFWGRVPLRLFSLKPEDVVHRCLALCALVLFALLPIYTLGHSAKTLVRYGIVCVELQTENGAIWRPVADSRDWQRNSGQFFAAPGLPMRLTSSETLTQGAAGDPQCTVESASVEWFGGFQAVCLLALVLAAAVAFLRAGLTLVRPGPTSRRKP